MRVFVVEGINRLSVANLLYNADLKQDVDYTLTKEDLKNTYEVKLSDKFSTIIGQMMMLSN